MDNKTLQSSVRNYILSLLKEDPETKNGVSMVTGGGPDFSLNGCPVYVRTGRWNKDKIQFRGPKTKDISVFICVGLTIADITSLEKGLDYFNPTVWVFPSVTLPCVFWLNKEKLSGNSRNGFYRIKSIKDTPIELRKIVLKILD